MNLWYDTPWTPWMLWWSSTESPGMDSQEYEATWMLGSSANLSCSLHRNKLPAVLFRTLLTLNSSWIWSVFSSSFSFFNVLKLVVGVSYTHVVLCMPDSTKHIFLKILCTRFNLCQRFQVFPVEFGCLVAGLLRSGQFTPAWLFLVQGWSLLPHSIAKMINIKGSFEHVHAFNFDEWAT